MAAAVQSVPRELHEAVSMGQKAQACGIVR